MQKNTTKKGYFCLNVLNFWQQYLSLLNNLCPAEFQ